MNNQQASRQRDLDAIASTLHTTASRISGLAEAADLMLDDRAPRINEPFDDFFAERVARVGTLMQIVLEAAAVVDDQATALERYQFALRNDQVQS